jgi:hypothetical protein
MDADEACYFVAHVRLLQSERQAAAAEAVAARGAGGAGEAGREQLLCAHPPWQLAIELPVTHGVTYVTSSNLSPQPRCVASMHRALISLQVPPRGLQDGRRQGVGRALPRGHLLRRLVPRAHIEPVHAARVFRVG